MEKVKDYHFDNIRKEDKIKIVAKTKSSLSIIISQKKNEGC